MTVSKALAGAAVMTLLVGVPIAQAQHRGGGGQGRGSGGAAAGRAAPPVVAPRGVAVAPLRFYRPYYSFRPRVSLGFGLWAGFPVAYAYQAPYYAGYYNPYFAPYAYPAPYPVYGSYTTAYPAYTPPAYPLSAYPPPPYPQSAYPPSGYPQSAYPPSGYPASGYPPPGSVGVQGPNQVTTGGVSFEISPDTAEVFVDGSYVGTVGHFTPMSQPLGLTPGRHRVEIRAPGYRTMDIDVDIVAGQVIPYQGVLER